MAFGGHPDGASRVAPTLTRTPIDHADRRMSPGARAETAMTEEALLQFGTVLVAKADVADDRKRLRLNLLAGVLNKHELGMLIQFLRAKQEALDAVDKVPDPG